MCLPKQRLARAGEEGKVKARAESEYTPRVLFDRKTRAIDDSGKKAYSDIFYIAPGESALLSLYGAPEVLKGKITNEDDGILQIESDSCFVLYKVSFGPVASLHVERQCGEWVNIQDEYDKLVANRQVFFEPVRRCGDLWTMSGCDNYAMLNIPGFYMFEVSDPELFNITRLEMVKQNVFETNAVPDNFKFGS